VSRPSGQIGAFVPRTPTSTERHPGTEPQLGEATPDLGGEPSRRGDTIQLPASHWWHDASPRRLLVYVGVLAALVVVAAAALLAYQEARSRSASSVQGGLSEASIMSWMGELSLGDAVAGAGTAAFRPTDAVLLEGRPVFLDSGSGALLFVEEFARVRGVDLQVPPGEGLARPRFYHLAPTQTGSLLVTDIANHRVWQYAPDGRFLGAFLTDEQTAAAGLGRPTGVLQTSDGRVFIADVEDHTVKVFNKAGLLLFSIGGEGSRAGEFLFPNDIIEAWDGQVVVADSNNRRVQVFDSQGEFVRAFSQTQGSLALALPRSLALDDRGNLHVSDTFAEKVSVFTIEGAYLGSYGFAGAASERVGLPEALVLIDGRAVIGDRSNRRLAIYGGGAAATDGPAGGAGATEPNATGGGR
jgi:hypothetical protein